MATTTFLPLHARKGSKGGGRIAALIRSVDYVENPNKTDGGEWVTAYECDPLTAPEEFMFSKRQYTLQTGRDYGDRDVIAYHLRQAFKPGETDAETANRIGYDLAMSLTKGKFAFVCATHVDKQHIHSHIIINSVSLDCSRKFRNFKNSSFAIRRISDQLCLENGLSVIENPKPSPGRDYGKWLGGVKAPTMRDNLCELIDNSISAGMLFEQFIARLQERGVEVKRGKQISMKPPGAKRFARLDTLGEDYSEQALRERCVGKRVVVKKSDSGVPSKPGVPSDSGTLAASTAEPQKPNLLIDI